MRGGPDNEADKIASAALAKARAGRSQLPMVDDDDQVADTREAAALLVGAADWIMREVVHQENRIGQEQTHARNLARAVREQAKRLLESVPADPPAAEGKA